MNETVRRYALSTLVTFLTGFSIVFALQIDELTLSSFTDGTIIGLLFAATRAGIKAVIEGFLAYQSAH